MSSHENLQERIRQLEALVEKQEKIIHDLKQQVTSGVDTTGTERSIFEHNIQLRNEVERQVQSLKVDKTMGEGQTDTDSETLSPGSGKDRSKRRILLVEDNLVNQEVAMGMLELSGCSVVLAVNGREAVELARSEYFDLILMDCHMPEMDGFEAAQSIRQFEQSTARVPIVALTADTQKGVQQQCLAAGMDGYLSKPFNQESLQAILNRWLPEKAPQSTEQGTMPQSKDTKPQQPRRHTIDPKALDSLRELQRPGMPDIVGRLIGVYLENTPELVEKIFTALEQQDAQAMQHAAHSLKSSSANLGAMQLSEISKQLEMLGREARLADALPLMSALKDEVNRVDLELKSLLNGIQATPV